MAKFKPMPLNERGQAIEALARWFESQEISVGDAVPICGEFIATAIAVLSKDRTHMRKGMRAINRTTSELAAHMFERLQDEE